MDVDGKNRRRVTNGCHPHWSPDGKSLLTVTSFRSPRQLTLVDVATGKRTRLLKNEIVLGQPAWNVVIQEKCDLSVVGRKRTTNPIAQIDNLSLISSGNSNLDQPCLCEGPALGCIEQNPVSVVRHHGCSKELVVGDRVFVCNQTQAATFFVGLKGIDSTSRFRL